ncbi:ABC-2 transporter permease [Clostridium felsineum]|uniref:ABC-2 transporter permease n=1 Tax=Clostridium felsineum TaxID=36839 RepID=UPI00358DC83A|nr:ABC-2 transporter permease [Clostridium felsineum]
MFSLVLKDILIHNKGWISIAQSIVINFFIVVILQFFGNSSVYIIFPFFISTSYSLSSCGLGEKYDIDIMINSLPVNRKTVVLSKYISSFIFFLIGVIFVIIFASIVKILPFGNITSFINIQDIIISFMFSILYIFMYLPIYFKIGYIKSQRINSILYFIIFVVLIIAVMLISSYKSSFKISFFIPWELCTLFLLIISIAISLKIYINREF